MTCDNRTERSVLCWCDKTSGNFSDGGVILCDRAGTGDLVEPQCVPRIVNKQCTSEHCSKDGLKFVLCLGLVGGILLDIVNYMTDVLLVSSRLRCHVVCRVVCHVVCHVVCSCHVVYCRPSKLVADWLKDELILWEEYNMLISICIFIFLILYQVYLSTVKKLLLKLFAAKLLGD